MAGRFDVGGGRKLYLQCRGTGSPTVVLSVGDDGDSSEWDRTFPFQDGLAQAAKTRTCSYDRSGEGRSDPPTSRAELPNLVGDLEHLLRAARLRGPYVLVGSSGGGYIAAGFAVAHRDQVSGVVLIDTPGPFINPSAEVIAATRWDNPANMEKRDYLRVEKDAWASRRRIGDIPMKILSVAYAATSADPNERENVKLQKGWLILSPRARQVVVSTGHVIYRDKPDLVISAIAQVVAAARR